MTDTRREEIARPLVWEKCDTYEFRAWSEFGVYCIDNNDGWWAFLTEECGDPFEAHADPVWTDDESAVDEMKAACKSDFECRVRRVVITPGTQPATEQPSVKEAAVDALASYQQADEDGIMVLVSRQAIEECLPALRSLAGDE